MDVDAEYTFWKTQYAKHTGFAMEPKELSFTGGTADFGARKAQVQIIRSGDLVADMWLVFDLAAIAGDGVNAYVPGDVRFTNDIGRALIEEVRLDIGGVIYDTKQSEFLHLWEELVSNDEQQLNRLTGKSKSTADLFDWAKETQKIYVPIMFWFTEDYAQALPLVGLYQHDVRVEFVFRTKITLLVAGSGVTYAVATETGGQISNMILLVEYVFLENAERNYFARGSHKYMIGQVQYLGSTSVAAGVSTLSVDLNFNHPTSELIWVFRSDANVGSPNFDYFIFTGEEVQDDAFSSMRLLLNNSERFTVRDPHFFRQVTNRRHHTRIPDKHIYTYPFALHPEQTDPSGHINFSRIDNTQMRFIFSSALSAGYELHIWARSLNWAKIERGLSKLFYA